MLEYGIVGAGLSGLVAAHLLKSENSSFAVIEKSRGVGGRTSTRRGEFGIRFDHGAQFFTLRDERIRELLRPLLDQGIIHRWDGQIPHDAYADSIKDSERFFAPQGMNRIAAYFAKDIPIRFETKVVRLEREKDAWKIFLISNGSDLEQVISARRLILTAPIPQALPLVEPFCSIRSVEMLSRISYRPCIAVLLAREAEFLFGKARWLRNESPIEWVCDNFLKGLSARPALTVHLKEHESSKLFQREDSEIIDLVKRELGLFEQGDFLYEAIHRWRFSQPLQTWIGPGRFHLENSSLMLIGDGFSGGRMEGAMSSALEGIDALKTA